jgi:peptide chain release factor 1
LSEQRALQEVWKSWKGYERVSGGQHIETSHHLALNAEVLNIPTQQIQSAEAILSNETDADMKTLAEEEITSLLEAQEQCRDQLVEAMFPEDPLHASGAIIELRNSIGGAESSIFVASMTRMYQRWCSAQPCWSVQTMSMIEPESSSMAGLTGLREAILQVEGPGAYGRLRFEAGIHRVQRVPATTKSAKLQSSTIAIVVLPFDASASEKTVDDVVDPKDVKTEVMRSRGAGGQHVNKTESAIRLTHLPTGITVSMQDSRSQQENRVKAWAILRGRLMDLKVKQDEEDARNLRGEQIVGLSRGDRVRTYNYPQDRVTDHRLQMSLSGLDAFMEGEEEGGLGTFVEGLQQRERETIVDARLKTAARDK